MTGPNDPQQPGPGDEPRYQPEQYPGQQPYPGQPQYPGQQQYPGQPQHPGQPQYPGQQPYPQDGGYGYQQPAAQKVGVLDRLGPRALQRAQPRFGVTLGGVGVALIVAGVLVWSFTYLIEGLISTLGSTRGGAPDDSRKFLGAALSAVVVAIGYALILKARPGALRTAGVVASALGVPLLMEFLTLDYSSGSVINTDAVFWVTVLVYLGTYLFVRGARGHTFYLGLTLLQILGYIIDKVDDSALNSLTAFGIRAVPGVGRTSLPGADVDSTTVGATALAVGLVYFGAAFWLDRGGRHGVAVAFVVAGPPAIAIGIAGLARDLDQIGTGIVLIVLGFALAAYGARFERRFTTWFWATAGASGFVVLLTDAVDSGTWAGIWLTVIGALVVLAGWRLGPLLGETPDVDEGVAAPAAPAPRKH